MARARNIKPKFFTNEQVVGVPFVSRLLFIGLWTIADRAGRLEDKPLQIKMQVFPGDSIDVNSCLAELQDAGLLLRYSINGSKYIQVLTFEKHQNPHKDESASEIPAPNLHSASTSVAQDLHETCPADSLLLIPDSLIPPTPAPPGRGRKTTTEDQKFDEAYAAYPKRPGCSKQDALKQWNARIKAGADPEAIIAGVKAYANYVAVSETAPNYIKMPATFFGPGKHYETDWTPVAPQGPAWWKSEIGKIDKAAEFGLAARPGEHPDLFEARIRRAIADKQSPPSPPKQQILDPPKADSAPVQRSKPVGMPALKSFVAQAPLQRHATQDVEP